MKRRIVLALLIGVATLSLAVGAAQDAPKIIEVEQLEDNLFVLRGQGEAATRLSSSRRTVSSSSTRRIQAGANRVWSRSER